MIASRYTPIDGADGTQVATLGGTTDLLSDLVTIPSGAAQARVQGAGNAEFAYRLDGSVGEGPAACLRATELTLANGASIQGAAVCSSGGATQVVVQFFRGAIGP
ncbi:MAG: hypothetical protein QY325_04410 [Flavobacteriales bacterium]|nr:MAG: hypothetical protein QY325_04410 [Flavobacteriales bacterium]